jgi:hypothetical protein
MKNSVFWDATPCGSGKNRRFGGPYRHHQGGKNERARMLEAIRSPKLRFFYKRQGVTSQKTAFFRIYMTKIRQRMLDYRTARLTR